MLAPEDVIAMAEKRLEGHFNPTLGEDVKAAIHAICEYIEMIEKAKEKPIKAVSEQIIHNPCGLPIEECTCEYSEVVLLKGGISETN